MSENKTVDTEETTPEKTRDGEVHGVMLHQDEDGVYHGAGESCAYLTNAALGATTKALTPWEGLPGLRVCRRPGCADENSAEWLESPSSTFARLVNYHQRLQVSDTSDLLSVVEDISSVRSGLLTGRNGLVRLERAAGSSVKDTYLEMVGALREDAEKTMTVLRSSMRPRLHAQMLGDEPDAEQEQEAILGDPRQAGVLIGVRHTKDKPCMLDTLLEALLDDEQEGKMVCLVAPTGVLMWAHDGGGQHEGEDRYVGTRRQVTRLPESATDTLLELTRGLFTPGAEGDLGTITGAYDAARRLQDLDEAHT